MNTTIIAIMYWPVAPDDIYSLYRGKIDYYIGTDYTFSAQQKSIWCHSKKNILSICATIKGILEKDTFVVKKDYLILVRKDRLYAYILRSFLALMLLPYEAERLAIKPEGLYRGTRLSTRNWLLSFLSDVADLILLLVYSVFCKF
jgi:hypothetical protein